MDLKVQKHGEYIHMNCGACGAAVKFKWLEVEPFIPTIRVWCEKCDETGIVKFGNRFLLPEEYEMLRKR